MKKLLYIFIAIAAIAGCNKPDNGDGGGNNNGENTGGGEIKEKTFAEKIAGEWHCSPSNIEADIYVSFTADGKFELYQQITEGAHRLYRGTWTADEAKKEISGKYNDGENWGSSYSITLSEDLNSMTWVDSASIEYVYSRKEIPAEVKETCAVVVKSAALL